MLNLVRELINYIKSKLSSDTKLVSKDGDDLGIHITSIEEESFTNFEESDKTEETLFLFNDEGKDTSDVLKESYTREINELMNTNEDDIKSDQLISLSDFIKMVDAQSETIKKYVRNGKIQPDYVKIHGNSKTEYFKKETIDSYAKEFRWEYITPTNMKEKFLEYVNTMSMSYSYKPVLLKAVFYDYNKNGKVLLSDVVDYFINYYKYRKDNGFVVEKKPCIYLKGGYSNKDVERNILTNPFKRFEDMNFMLRSKDKRYIKVNQHIIDRLTKSEMDWIINHCDNKLREYYNSQ